MSHPLAGHDRTVPPSPFETTEIMADGTKHAIVKSEASLIRGTNGKDYNGLLQVLCMLGLLGVLGHFGGVQHDAWLVLVGAAPLTVFLVLLRFDSISKLKAFKGLFEMEGAVRRAEAVTDEAKATVEQLKAVGINLAKPFLRLAATSGRFGGHMTLSGRVETTNKVVAALRDAGCTDEQVADVRAFSDQVVRFDLAARVLRLAGEKLSETNRDFNMSGSPLLGERFALIGLDAKGSHIPGKEWSVPSLDQVKAYLSKYNVTDAAVLKCLADYERYLSSGTVPADEHDE